jgi:hypothetical protein
MLEDALRALICPSPTSLLIPAQMPESGQHSSQTIDQVAPAKAAWDFSEYTITSGSRRFLMSGAHLAVCSNSKADLEHIPCSSRHPGQDRLKRLKCDLVILSSLSPAIPVVETRQLKQRPDHLRHRLVGECGLN